VWLFVESCVFFFRLNAAGVKCSIGSTSFSNRETWTCCKFFYRMNMLSTCVGHCLGLFQVMLCSHPYRLHAIDIACMPSIDVSSINIDLSHGFSSATFLIFPRFFFSITVS